MLFYQKGITGYSQERLDWSGEMDLNLYIGISLYPFFSNKVSKTQIPPPNQPPNYQNQVLKLNNKLMHLSSIIKTQKQAWAAKLYNISEHLSLQIHQKNHKVFLST